MGMGKLKRRKSCSDFEDEENTSFAQILGTTQSRLFVGSSNIFVSTKQCKKLKTTQNIQILLFALRKTEMSLCAGGRLRPI
jgi:hypothetical protein